MRSTSPPLADEARLSLETPSPRVAVIFEQHLGHRTYQENLRAGAEDIADLELSWWPITYADAGRFAPLRRLAPRVGDALVGRREVRRALTAPADVRVYNTQVVAALGGSPAREKPYVVITDITPVQQDQMAEGYGHRLDRLAPVRWWKHHVNRDVFRSARWCVGWSSWAAESIVRDYGVPQERVHVVPPGLDLELWRPTDRAGRDKVRILFVGGDFDRKGGPDLLEAFRLLPETPELVIVTNSDVRPGERVTVVRDAVPNDRRLLDLYRTSDVFALPTHAEAFGIAAAEATASGLPVVASPVGGLCDIVVDDETGLVVPSGDPIALAKALRRLVTEPALRGRLGAGARRHAERAFDAGRNARRLVDLARSAAEIEMGDSPA